MAESIRSIARRAIARPIPVVLLVLSVLIVVPADAWAQLDDTGLISPQRITAKPGEQMLVEADQLIYDYDNDTVSAVDNVKIYYAGYTLEADRVTYAQSTGKLFAEGRVKLTDPSGIVYRSEFTDITDDFREGFVASLRVETPERTYFAAERADRSEGERTTFVRGVYTACEPCKDRPEKPPLWQVKAKKIVHNQTEKTIEFQNASFEFLGVPIAWVPYFTAPDPTVKRKSGLLAPSVGYTEDLGYWVTVPYFLALAPSYDLTLSATYYTEQGFLGEAEWRQRLANGQYTLQMAGIDQQDPKAFLRFNDNGDAIGGTFAQRDFRGGVRTTGDFSLSRWWTFGWDGTLTTDRTFTRNYNVLNQDTAITTSEVNLTGLRDRSYFDARAEYFQVLTDSTAPRYSQGRQAVITPVVDHDYIFNSPILGGELSLTSNLTVWSRDEDDPFTVSGETFYHGLAGDFVRATAEVGWQRKLIGPLGQVITPFASARGDLFSLNPTATVPPQLTTESDPARGMVAAGVEWSWPFLITGPTGGTHVIEPIAQVIARPDEPLAGKLNNNDAQSLVFDDTTLLRRDKFSGDDRVEGGTRLNAGIRYVGNMANGMTVEALFGQSYQLAGLNSYAVTDIADVGAFSGLESTASDYVARLSFDTGSGSRLALRGRFDDEDLTINRTEAEFTGTAGPVTASATYIYAREIPAAGITEPTSQVTGQASVRFAENWRAFGAAIYDFNDASLNKASVGIGFDNSCLTMSLAYSEVHGTDIPTRTVMLRVLLRTLAESNYSVGLPSG